MTKAIDASTYQVDFELHDHGSVCILFAKTKAAEAWVDEHLPADAQTWGVNGIVIEPRYVEAIATGIIADGLEITG